MKQFLTLLFCIFLSVNHFAQVPQAIPYQAVARNAAGNPLINQLISLRISLLNNTANGPLLYRETQSVTTNAQGLFSINVGTGSVVSGNFSSINWGSGNKFLQVEMDPAGGTAFVNMGTQQMMSVPYALFSGNTSVMPSGTSAGQILVWNGLQWVATSVCSLFQTDNSNCGSCGNVCPPAVPNGTSTCVNGVCVVTCNSGFANCDNVVANGCEVNLMTNTASCGTCGNACPPAANGTVSCVNGVCTIVCDNGYANCDNVLANGCEAYLFESPANCGNCGTVCPSRPNAQSACQQGTCYFICDPGFGDCDGNSANGCETDFSINLSHCGSCNVTCNLPNAISSCNAGVCSIVQCNTGFADCDGITSNGCEVNLNSSSSNCGTCGNVCSFPNAITSCVNGTCAIVGCNPGFGNCDGITTNGCEVNLNTNTSSCGICGNSCNFPNAIGACNAGVCVIIQCNAGYANCDGITSNGCEVNLLNSNNNCNACGNACPANKTCVNGTCQ